MHPLHVIAVGPFGRAVADRIGEFVPDCAVSLAPGGPLAGPRPPDAEIHLLAAWRRVPPLERELDALAHRRGTPWLPVVLDHPLLRVGPAVVPGTGPCHDCYRRRTAQHAPSPAVSEALDRHYERDPSAGLAGYLPATALLAAVTALETIARLRRDPASEAGRLRQINPLTQQMTTGRTVGVHGCPRCGLGRDEAGRSYRELRAALGEALGEATPWAA
jgi:bacteriocin biosynthesis cyclodehydratase domain-containing protein